MRAEPDARAEETHSRRRPSPLLNQAPLLVHDQRPFVYRAYKARRAAHFLKENDRISRQTKTSGHHSSHLVRGSGTSQCIDTAMCIIQQSSSNVGGTPQVDCFDVNKSESRISASHYHGELRDEKINASINDEECLIPCGH